MDTEIQDEPNGEEVVAAPPPPVAFKKSPKPAPERPERSASAESFAREDDRSVYEWLADIGTGAALRIKLERKSPRDWDGHPIAGWLADFDEPFTESEITRRWGGGKFYVKTFRPNPKGGWMAAGGRTFEISGDPKVVRPLGELAAAAAPPMGRYAADDLSLSERAMSSMERQAISAEKRARELEDDARKGSGLDPMLLKLLSDNPQMRALEARLDSMARIVADKDAKIMELVTRKPESTFQDRLLEKMTDNENGHITTLRAQHESEVRQLRQSHTDDVKQIRSHAHEELQMRERSHEREISTLRESHAGQLKSTEQSYEARLDGLKGRLSDLERQLTEAKHENVELRAKKDKSPVETMEELATMKNAMEALGLGGGGEPEPSSMFERVLNGVMGSRLAEAVATRVENAPVAPPAPPQQQRRPMRRQAATGQQSAPVAPGPMASTRPPKAPPAVPTVSPVELALAVAFIESSITNETPPEAFATSARSMVPEAILAALRSMSVDQFVAIAKPDGASVILTQRGRNFLRQTKRHLMGGGEAEEVVAEALA